ncbi:hypothetical protein ACQKP0_02920 [Heyndrickxia sp. NPDC080065]|uniref:hypothetical protein n=1 Tax=Heyndrickxia sp. NPDC080065 TaxID=3390568 RepID=UPI003CFCAC69
MTEAKGIISEEIHKKLAIQCFNQVWDLLEKTERSQTDDDTMIHKAHASRYHWGIVGAPVNFSRGEWQISRVYSVLKRPEPAIFHAKRNLEICLEHGIEDFDLAFAFEALARAHQVAGNKNEVNHYKDLALEASKNIKKEGDRNHFLNDLNTI